MPTLQQQIANKFIDKLAKATTERDAAKVEQLRALFGDGKKLKPDDLVNLFSLPSEPEIK
jgi:hypothetical protein